MIYDEKTLLTFSLAGQKSTMCKINKCKTECKKATQTWWKLCQVAWSVQLAILIVEPGQRRLYG